MECPRCNEHLYRGIRFCPTCGLCVEDFDLLDPQQEMEDEPKNDVLADELSDEHSSKDDTLDLHLPAQNSHDAADAAEDSEDVDSSSQSTSYVDDELQAEGSSKDVLDGSDAQPLKKSVEEEMQAKPRGFPANMRLFAARCRKVFIVALLVCVVALVAIGARAMHDAEVARLERERLEAEELARNTPHAVRVGLVIPGYNEETDSPVPIRVVGTTETNKNVDEVSCMRTGQAELNLLPGSYTVSLAGNPVTADGRLLRGSIDSFTVVVSDGLADDGEQEKSNNPVFAFEGVAPENVSDSDIDAVRQWMEGAGVEGFQAYVDALLNLRQQELDRIAAELEEREAAEMSEVTDVVRRVDQQLQQLQKKKSAESKASSSSSSSSSSASNKS